jgi:hypothetical protein
MNLAPVILPQVLEFGCSGYYLANIAKRGLWDKKVLTRQDLCSLAANTFFLTTQIAACFDSQYEVQMQLLATGASLVKRIIDFIVLDKQILENWDFVTRIIQVSCLVLYRGANLARFPNYFRPELGFLFSDSHRIQHPSTFLTYLSYATILTTVLYDTRIESIRQTIIPSSIWDKSNEDIKNRLNAAEAQLNIFRDDKKRLEAKLEEKNEELKREKKLADEDKQRQTEQHLKNIQQANKEGIQEGIDRQKKIGLAEIAARRGQNAN